MKSYLWIIAGIVAAAVGAAVWAAIAYYAHFELAWIAWLIGIAVGGAVVATAGDNAGMATGIAAAAIAIAGILGGKYAAIRMDLGDFIAEAGITEVSDELVISYIADDIVRQRMDEGQTIEWPTEWELGEASEPEEYPADIWAEADDQWNRGDEAYRQQYRNYVEHTVKTNMAEFVNDVSEDALLANIDLFDMLFFLLAIVSAWKIGSGGGGD